MNVFLADMHVGCLVRLLYDDGAGKSSDSGGRSNGNTVCARGHDIALGSGIPDGKVESGELNSHSGAGSGC